MGFIVKNTTLPNLLDLIAPLSCRGCGALGRPLCEKCKNYIIANHKDYCLKCKHEKSTLLCPACDHLHLPPTFTLGPRHSLIGRLIHDLKYDSIRPLARPLAEILAATLPPISDPVIVVPLPTASHHIRQRGLDHTLLIARHFAKLRGSRYTVQKLLIRNKNTTQVGSDAKTRLTQAAEAYSLNPKLPIDPNATYLLLDDVWTTGASLEAAYNILRAAGIQAPIIVALAVNKVACH